MSLLGRLFGGAAKEKDATSYRDGYGHFYFIRCGKCGEKIRVRIDDRWDMEQEFEGSGDSPSGYMSTKDVVGNKCFQMIHMVVHFDTRHQEIGREIKGGEFITKAQYEQLDAP